MRKEMKGQHLSFDVLVIIFVGGPILFCHRELVERMDVNSRLGVDQKTCVERRYERNGRSRDHATFRQNYAGRRIWSTGTCNPTIASRTMADR